MIYEVTDTPERQAFLSINYSHPTLTPISIDSNNKQQTDVLCSLSFFSCSGCDHQKSGAIIHTWGAAHGPKCDPEVVTSRPRFGHAGPAPSLLPGTPHLSALRPVYPAALAGKDKPVGQEEDNTLEPLQVAGDKGKQCECEVGTGLGDE